MFRDQHPAYDMTNAVMFAFAFSHAESAFVPLDEAIEEVIEQQEQEDQGFRERIEWAREHTPSFALERVPLRMFPAGLNDKEREKMGREFDKIYKVGKSQPFLLATIARFSVPQDAVLFKMKWR